MKSNHAFPYLNYYPVEAPLDLLSVWPVTRGIEFGWSWSKRPLQGYTIQPGMFFVSDEHPDVNSVQILSGKFAKEFSELEDALEKKGEGNPLDDLYRRSEESELGQAEKRVRSRLGY